MPFHCAYPRGCCDKVKSDSTTPIRPCAAGQSACFPPFPNWSSVALRKLAMRNLLFRSFTWQLHPSNLGTVERDFSQGCANLWYLMQPVDSHILARAGPFCCEGKLFLYSDPWCVGKAELSCKCFVVSLMVSTLFSLSYLLVHCSRLSKFQSIFILSTFQACKV